MSKASFMLGFIAGVTSVGGVAQKEPVAYLYNGVRLPKLPEWDREKYPYAWILSISPNDYALRVASEPVTYKYDNFLAKDYVYVSNGTGNTYDLKENGWVIFHQDTLFGGNYFSVSKLLFSWVNHDVINTADSTVHQSASDPIPVYE